MKIITSSLLSSAFFLAACIPPANLPQTSTITPELDRFEAASYPADTALSDDLQGLWIMTTKNYFDSTSVKNTRTLQTSDIQTSGSFRMACTIIMVGTGYNSSCFGAGDLSLSEGNLINTDSTWTATVNDNTHISGTYYFENISRNNFKSLVTTTTTGMNFEMVKINATGTTIGNMILTTNDVTETSDIIEFQETEFTEITFENDIISSSNNTSTFNAFGTTGSVFGLYSQLAGSNISAFTESLFVESTSASILSSSNTTTLISRTITGDDVNNVAFSGSIDITL